MRFEKPKKPGQKAIKIVFNAFSGSISEGCASGTIIACAMLRKKRPFSDGHYIGVYGFDVIEHVGMAIFVHCRGNEEILHDLASRNVFISERHMSNLGRKFVVYLALIHMESQENNKEKVPKEVKKIIRDTNLPGKISALFKGKSNLHTNRHLRS